MTHFKNVYVVVSSFKASMDLSPLLHRGFWVLTGNVTFASEVIQLMRQLLFLQTRSHLLQERPFSPKHSSPTLGGRSRSLRLDEAQWGWTRMYEKELEVNRKPLVSSFPWFISIYA